MQIPDWAGPLASQLWSFVAVAIAVYQLGSVSKRIADRMGWRHYRTRDVTALVKAAQNVTIRDVSSGDLPLPSDASWYDITLRLHPLTVGALFGLLPLPTLDVIDGIAKDPEAGAGAMVAARCAWFMLAGALSGQIYEAIKFAFTAGRERLLGLIGKGTPPAQPMIHMTPAQTPEDTNPGSKRARRSSKEPPIRELAPDLEPDVVDLDEDEGGHAP